MAELFDWVESAVIRQRGSRKDRPYFIFAQSLNTLSEWRNPFTVEWAVIAFEHRISKGFRVHSAFVDQKERWYVSHLLVTPQGIVRENEIGNCADVYMCLDGYPFEVRASVK
jgi:hypothetical protein